MRHKLALWLMATLVVLGAGWLAPVTDRVSYPQSAIVALQASEQRSISDRSRKRQRPPISLSAAFPHLPVRPLPGLKRVLFQRPPPVSLFPRV